MRVSLLFLLLLELAQGFQTTQRFPHGQTTSVRPSVDVVRFSSFVSPKPLRMSQSSSNNDTSNLKATTASAGSMAVDRPSFPVILWKFSRPHTIIGSAAAVPALHCLAAPTLGAAFSSLNMQAILFAVVPALLMNIYITGLNQITDVEIDRVNKPNLVIPAGLLTKKDATTIVSLCAILSLSMGLCSPRFSTQGLNVALWGSFVLGTLYSLPPVRLKRFPMLAAFCIVAVRGAIINASFFAHAKAAAFGGAGSVLANLATDPRCYWSSGFFAIFGVVIALMKDVPDVAGDSQSKIRTFSVRLGQKRVFTSMRRLLSGLFWAVGGAFLRAALQNTASAQQVICRVTAGVMSILGGWSVRHQAQGVNPEDSGEVYDYYMHLWKLFYLSYLVLPFAR